MLLESVNEVTMNFHTVRLVSGKNGEYVSSILEYFQTEKEAYDFTQTLPNYKFKVSYEPLRVSIKLT